MLGAMFALLIQQGVIIYFNLTRDEPQNQVVMSTYVVTDSRVQIYGEGALVSIQECEEFRERIHNPPDIDGDTDWAVTICELLDPEELEIDQDQADTIQNPVGRQIQVPGSQEGNQ